MDATRMRMRRWAKSVASPLALLALASAVGIGCGSSDTRDAPPAAVEKPSPSPQPKASDEQPLESITIKKGDKKTSSAGLDKADPGNVSFDFQNADLGKVALPLFSSQAGTTVEYAGPPRSLSLRLTNVPWKDALCEICRFAQMHAVSSQVHGRIELKPGYADARPFLERWSPNTGDTGSGPIGEPTASGGTSSSGSPANRGGNTTAGGAPGNGPGPDAGDPIEDPNAKGKATIERLRTGVSTTNSGQ